MEDQVLIQESIEIAQQVIEQNVRELSQLQLAVVGGGCAEVCPY